MRKNVNLAMIEKTADKKAVFLYFFGEKDEKTVEKM